MTLFTDAAALYVALGWNVLALGEGSKIPAVKGGRGFKDATDDANVIDRLAKKFPRANIGVATGKVSGITVIDIDPRNGGDATIAALAARGFLFPRGPEARTGNNGRHLFFVYHPGIKASKDKLGPGIDIKTDGGYVVAAPSVIARSEQGPGGSYRWVVSPENEPLPYLPTWVVQKLAPPAPVRPRFEPAVRTTEGAERSLEAMARKLASAPQGDRNNLLNWCAYKAGGMVRDGKIGAEVVAARLTQAALAAGLALPEVRATIASGIKGGVSKA